MYLVNGNLIIREATINDAKCLCNWWIDGAIMEHAGFPNGIHTDINELTNKLKNQNSNSKRLIIEINSNPVGEMSYNINNKIAEIGIKICNFNYQEKGYGTKALKMLIKYLFNVMNISKVILDTNLKNTRAQHVYEKLGFKKINTRFNSWENQIGELQSFVDYELLETNFLI
ncbi:MAG: GNAT family protein [Clostridium perfringens]|nr:GNAT family protein [Clostridium perfringens]